MSRYRTPAGVLRAEVDGQEVLLNPDTSVYHLVNKTGRALLVRLESGDTLEDAIERLSDETGQTPERIESDVRAFVDAMSERGLLEEVRQ